jgi:ABC-type ATPase with predicted acetyltransferase domain
VRTCDSCGREVEAEFRFCPNCGTPRRLKVVEHFRPAAKVGAGWLRVSVYLKEPQHVRFSIWKDETAEAATSLDPLEAQRLADFLNSLARHARREPFTASVRRSADALRSTVRELVR